MNLRTLAAIAAALILAASCTSGTEGIFASIEREQKIVSLGGLSKSATVTSMAEFNGRYYATGGKALFSREVAGSTWDKAAIAGNSEVKSVGVTSGRLYAVAGKSLYSTADGSNWSIESIPAGETAYDLVPVRTGDGVSSTELVLVTDASGAKNNVYRLNGTTTSADLKTVAGFGLSAPVVSAVNDGTRYYLASESFVWELNAGFAPAKVAVTSAPVSGYAGLLYLSSTDTLYLSTLSNSTLGGGIYSAAATARSPAAVTFTAIATDVKSGSNPVSFGQFLSNDTNGSLWVATGATIGQEGTGYMEITGSSLSQTPTTDNNNYISSAIKTFSVGTLFKGPTEGKYFLGTVAHGLWTWDTSKKIWSQQ